MTTELADEDVGFDTEELVGASEDLGQALVACDFPLLVWRIPDGVVQLANQPAAELVGLRLDRLIGTPAADFVGPPDAVRRTMAMFATGELDDTHSERWVRSPDGGMRPVSAWTRVVELDGVRAAVTLAIPVAEVSRLGRDPTARWRDLTTVAVGVADRRLRVRSISNDVREVLHLRPEDVIGRSLLDLVELRSPLVADCDAVNATVVHRQARLRHAGGGWVEGCLLLGAASRPDSSDVTFALVADPAPAGDLVDRVAELERRLRLIGAEVRAAGLLDDVADLPSVGDHPQLRELTSRQWEILSRLRRGDRAPTIAAELYISPSTVRNHLSAIYQKFGVHSQAELLAALRSPRP